MGEGLITVKYIVSTHGGERALTCISLQSATHVIFYSQHLDNKVRVVEVVLEGIGMWGRSRFNGYPETL